MDIFSHAAFQMIELTLLAAAGVIARKLDFMNSAFDTMLSRLVMNFSLPALMISSVLNNTGLPDFATIMRILGFSMLAYVLMMVVSYLVPRLYPNLEPATRGAHSFMMGFGNTSFVGLPILNAIFGPAAVFYGVINSIPFGIFVFTCGEAMIKQGGAPKAAPSLKRRVKRVLRNLMNPAMIACIVALVLASLGITDNGGLAGNTLNYIGQMTVPASMLIIGSTLATMSPKEMLSHAKPYVTSAMRLLVIPIVLFVVLRPFIDDPLILGVIVVGAGMPVASMGTMMALMYDGDVKAMSQGTFITTVLALGTIPLLAVLVS